MQSKRMSFAEACTNIAIGYLISVATNFVVLPLFGYRTSILESFQIGAVFSAVSIVRSYTLRRIFNRIKHENPANRHRKEGQ